MPRTATPPPDSALDVEQEAPLQGEGNYAAARRHRRSVKKFIEAGEVDGAARAAAPRSAQEEREMKDAEEAAKAHARR